MEGNYTGSPTNQLPKRVSSVYIIERKWVKPLTQPAVLPASTYLPVQLSAGPGVANVSANLISTQVGTTASAVRHG